MATSRRCGNFWLVGTRRVILRTYMCQIRPLGRILAEFTQGVAAIATIRNQAREESYSLHYYTCVHKSLHRSVS